jgi:cell division protein FtsW (lipid II flippase)
VEIHFQPPELLVSALIAFLASYLADNRDLVKTAPCASKAPRLSGHH